MVLVIHCLPGFSNTGKLIQVEPEYFVKEVKFLLFIPLDEDPGEDISNEGGHKDYPLVL